MAGALTLLTAAAAQAACDTRWNGTTGDWSDASRWSAGVPTQFTGACITAAGSYTVTVTGTQVAEDLDLGGFGSTPTLILAGRLSLPNGGGSGNFSQDANALLEVRVTSTTTGTISAAGRAILLGRLLVSSSETKGTGSRRFVAAAVRQGEFRVAQFIGATYTLSYDRTGAILSAQSAADGPPPVLGTSVSVGRVKGTVKVRVKGSNRFVALSAGKGVPPGSELDTTKGTVALTSAADSSGTPQKAQFNAGRFVVSQSRSSALTTLALSGPELKACPKGRAAAAAKKKPTRRLFGSGKGRFVTKGKYGSATIRGTRWLVQDFCDRTVFKSLDGTVSIRDAVKRRTVTLKRGKSYTAFKRR